MVEFESPESISAALTTIITNPEEARRVGLNGYRKYMEFFSPESNGKLLHELLMSL